MVSRYLFFLTCLAWLPATAVTAQTDAIADEWNFPEARQFDFWIGKWDVNLRMIQEDQTWKDSVQATVEVFPILDGKAILELWDSRPIKGFSLRHYDPQKKEWVLYLNWPSNSQSSLGSLEGRFRHGRGEFLAGSGKRLSRYTFCDITPRSLRWDDAFSADGGRTWRSNWIMEFSRTADRAAWPAGTNAHTWHTGQRCQGAAFDQLNQLAGRWSGELEPGDSGSGKLPATLHVYRILDGCAVIRFLEYRRGDQTVREFGLLSWNASRSQFEELRLDNQPGSTAQILRGQRADDRITVAARFQREGREVQRRHQWIPDDPGADTLKLVSSEKTGEGPWNPSLTGTFRRQPAEPDDADPQQDQARSPASQPVNRVCPRSGKPVSPDSLTTYRGHTVGFCNPRCRDDFAGHVADRPADRAFFDERIDRANRSNDPGRNRGQPDSGGSPDPAGQPLRR